MILREIKKVNPNIRKAVRRNAATFCNLRLGVRKIIISLLRARMLMQNKVSMHVETVCLLSKLREAKHHVNVKLDMDELDLTSAEAKATYKEIQDWVQEKSTDSM